MPISVQVLKDRYQPQIAPLNDPEFYRILSEADERLLKKSRGYWTRNRVELTPDANQLVTLDAEYSAIVACRLDELPRGVRWEESEFYEEGVGELPIDGCRARIVDQGLVSGVRTYKVTSSEIETVYCLCKYDKLADITSGEDETLCPVSAAVKLMMLAIIYEEANELGKARDYEMMALAEIKEHEDAYRGIAKEIFKPSQYMVIPRKSRTNIR